MVKSLRQFTLILTSVNFSLFFSSILVLFIVGLPSCDQNNTPTGKDGHILPAAEMDQHVKKELSILCESIGNRKPYAIADTLPLPFFTVSQFYYKNSGHHAIWSSQQQWKPFADSLLAYLATAIADGLFSDDYHYATLAELRRALESDSQQKQEPLLWAKADLLFTDAFFHVLQDLKQGRLQPDSLGWKNNKNKQLVFFSNYLNRLLSGDSVSSIARGLQPTLREYVSLKNSLPTFLDSMDTKTYTYLEYPYKDSLRFVKKLLQRLKEEGIFFGNPVPVDSSALSRLLQNYQAKMGLKLTGKVSGVLVSLLNDNDKEKLKRIAITLDKYKRLPERLPEKYIWVNLPSYRLQVRQDDSLVMESKVIIGKPGTPTPRITSQISDLVIFPTWTVPNSIILKEILPGLKKNTGYLARKGLALFSNDGTEVDPGTVDWSLYKKGIPYYVRQASGDNNALGVIKFNFKNPYAVYLHDTNQRYLFKNKMRSLSHGCVRVEDWKKLAFYIARNDSLHHPVKDSAGFTPDSITTWITRKERHVVPIKKQIPVFILYFGCEGAKGTVRFYDDVYGEDKVLRERYFAHK